MNTDQYILGISAFYHDSAAVLLKNDEIMAAAQEERFTRVRHDPRFPSHAINYCLEEAFIEPDELDCIAFYDHPLLTWDRIMANAVVAGEQGYPVFESALKSVLGIKLWVEKYVRETIGGLGKEGKVLFSGHHMSHAASTFYPSPFKNAAIVTLDGVGEWSTTTIAKGEGARLELLKEINYPHSLGLLYSALTYYCGFKINSGEYKLMGLAPYGQPKYVKEILDNLVDVKADGSYRLNTDYFGYIQGQRTTNDAFHRLFGGPPREPESRITRKEMDLAASIQAVTEQVLIKIARYAKEVTGYENLCLAGGVALNCVGNGKLHKTGMYKDIWIQPAAGDAGGALGAAYIARHHFRNEPRERDTWKGDSQKGSLLGPSFSSQEVEAFLERKKYPFKKFASSGSQNEAVARDLAGGKIIGFFSGRMEFGPRSLGARSIIGDARNSGMQSKMNLKIKFRESFRPFAPAVLAEDVQTYFDFKGSSPYMLFVAPVREELRTERRHNDEGSDDMIEEINHVRSTLPAITHVDYSARLQTVHSDTNPHFYGLLKEFKKQTGCGVLVNTSFNLRGEPIVCTLEDAYQCFMRTDIDILVLENFVLYKEEQPAWQETENWKNRYGLD